MSAGPCTTETGKCTDTEVFVCPQRASGVKTSGHCFTEVAVEGLHRPEKGAPRSRRTLNVVIPVREEPLDMLDWPIISPEKFTEERAFKNNFQFFVKWGRELIPAYDYYIDLALDTKDSDTNFLSKPDRYRHCRLVGIEPNPGPPKRRNNHQERRMKKYLAATHDTEWVCYNAQYQPEEKVSYVNVKGKGKQTESEQPTPSSSTAAPPPQPEEEGRLYYEPALNVPTPPSIAGYRAPSNPFKKVVLKPVLRNPVPPPMPGGRAALTPFSQAIKNTSMRLRSTAPVQEVPVSDRVKKTKLNILLKQGPNPSVPDGPLDGLGGSKGLEKQRNEYMEYQSRQQSDSLVCERMVFHEYNTTEKVTYERMSRRRLWTWSLVATVVLLMTVGFHLLTYVHDARIAWIREETVKRSLVPVVRRAQDYATDIVRSVIGTVEGYVDGTASLFETKLPNLVKLPLEQWMDKEGFIEHRTSWEKLSSWVRLPPELRREIWLLPSVGMFILLLVKGILEVLVRVADIDPADRRNEYRLEFLGNDQIILEDKRGISAVQSFHDTTHSKRISVLDRWRLTKTAQVFDSARKTYVDIETGKLVVTETLSWWVLYVELVCVVITTLNLYNAGMAGLYFEHGVWSLTQIWIHSESGEYHYPNLLLIAGLLCGLIGVRRRRDRTLDRYVGEMLADGAAVNQLKRDHTKDTPTLTEVTAMMRSHITRLDNVNWRADRADWEEDNVLVAAAIRRYLVERKWTYTEDFRHGARVHGLGCKNRKYTSVYLTGYRCGEPDVPLRSLYDLALNETRPGYTRAILLKTSNGQPYLRLYTLSKKAVCPKCNSDSPDTFTRCLSCGFKLPEKKHMMELHLRKPVHEPAEKVMLRQLPMYVPLTCPIPDTGYWRNMVEGCLKRNARVGAKTPLVDFRLAENADSPLMDEFHDFVKEFVEKHYKPLSPDADLSVETWLENSKNYNEERKNELRAVYQTMCDTNLASDRTRLAKFFLKTEQYTECKYPRLINAMNDWVKLSLGPASRAMEEVVYANPPEIPVIFIKHTPVRERAAEISKLFERVGLTYKSTDYSTFEVSFQERVMLSCEMLLYRHLLKHHPKILEHFEAIAGKNVSKNNIMWFICEAIRMSGETITSLGNGFTNMMLLLFACHKQQAKVLGAAVEGDDLIAAILGKLDIRMVEQLGFEIKVVESNWVGDAGFCSMYYDSQDMVQITDVREKVARIGFSSSTSSMHAGEKRMLELLRAKGLSLGYEVPGCPILSHLAHAIERVTRSVKAKFGEEDAWWEAQVMKEVDDTEHFDSFVEEKHDALVQGKCNATRQLVERNQGISIELQIRIEKYLDSLVQPQELGGPVTELFDSTCDGWRSFYNHHVVSSEMGSSWRVSAN